MSNFYNHPGSTGFYENAALAHSQAMQHIYQQEKAQELIILSVGFAIPRANVLYVRKYTGADNKITFRIYLVRHSADTMPYLELWRDEGFEFWERYTGQILADDTRPDAQQALARARKNVMADYELTKDLK